MPIRLNRLGVPCAYARDGRTVLRGKRKQRTSGLWRPGRVRNLIISTTYMGRHEYGKRSSNKARKLIARAVPAIVTEAMWNKAQQTLRSNQLFSGRNSVNRYLMRGKVRCGLCGLTYIGTMTNRPSGKREFYYKCNGKHGARGLYGEKGQRCPAKDLNGTYLETLIWEEVQGFLRNPGPVLQELHQRMTASEKASKNGHRQIEHLELAVANKADERTRILTLFRRGRIHETTFDQQLHDQQLHEIEQEEANLQQAIEEAQRAELESSNGAADLASAEELLSQLRKRLGEPVSWDLKRRLVEVLVGQVRVDTSQASGKKDATIIVTYRFASPVVTCTDTRAGNNVRTQ